MSNKNIYSRIQQKHDTEANWGNAKNFTPLIGEIIIYDKDDTHPLPRFKIGNGIDNVNDLEFVSESVIYKQNEEPEDAPEGALWIDMDAEGGSGGGGGSGLPEVDSSNNGAFLRVVNGTWAVASVPKAEEVRL